MTRSTDNTIARIAWFADRIDEGWSMAAKGDQLQSSDLRSLLSTAQQTEELREALDLYRDFVEQIACSCIPDYEEAKADAQDLMNKVDALHTVEIKPA